MAPRLIVAALAAAIVLAGTALALPPAALHALQRDWCSQGAYARAEHARGVDRITRSALRSAARLVRRHHDGCLLAMRAPHVRRERLPATGACPHAALLLTRGATTAAERAAAIAEPRSLLPVVVTANDRTRVAQLRHACGAPAARRSVVVSLSLNGLLPSASLSERVVAVARFPRSGWRVYQVLH
jgi:hypothetical protein